MVTYYRCREVYRTNVLFNAVTTQGKEYNMESTLDAPGVSFSLEIIPA